MTSYFLEQVLPFVLGVAPEAAEASEATEAAHSDGTEPTEAVIAADTARIGKLEARLDALEATTKELEAANEELEEANEELEEANELLTEELEYVQDDTAYNEEQIKALMPLSSRLSGYVDVGFFYVSGDGSGIRPDFGHRFFPEWEGVVPDSWVFMGDPLSTTVNSRGEPADTADSRAVVYDPIDNRGRASFIVNALNLEYAGAVGERFSVHGMVDFLPRNRDPASPEGNGLGDYVDVKHAYMKWSAPTKRFSLDIYGGKFDPVMGHEYRIQEAPDRITVTPSLICRYLCGRTTGLKVRSKFIDDSLIFNVAVTNGSSFVEGFGFFNDIDTNNSKSASGRLSYRLPVEGDIEFGASGLVGAQDLQRADDTLHWQAGADIHLQWGGAELTAEFVKGHIRGNTEPGEPRCNAASCLDFMGAYGLFGYRITNWMMPFIRADWRDALHLQGSSFVYISKLLRGTGGVRFDVGQHVILKGEYTYAHELGGIPQFRNDTFTTSAVARF